MPSFHTKTIESILDPVAQQVSHQVPQCIFRWIEGVCKECSQRTGTFQPTAKHALICFRTIGVVWKNVLLQAFVTASMQWVSESALYAWDCLLYRNSLLLWQGATFSSDFYWKFLRLFYFYKHRNALLTTRRLCCLQIRLVNLASWFWTCQDSDSEQATNCGCTFTITVVVAAAAVNGVARSVEVNLQVTVGTLITT